MRKLWLTLLALLFSHHAWSLVDDPLAYSRSFNGELETAQGTKDWADVQARLAEKRVVYVGEIHTRYADHLFQLTLLDTLYRQNPELAIGVEWFQQAFQPWLDAYISVKIDEGELLHQTEYFQRWRVDFRLLRPILRYARENQIRVLALNAPSELTRQVATLGRDSLSEQQKALMPTIHPPGKEQQDRLESFFEGKIPPNREVDDFIYAQRIWDETMAANIVDYLQTHPTHRMLVFAGNFHIAHQAAIPEDVARQMPELADRQMTLSSGNFEDFKAGYVDYFAYTEPQSLPKIGKIGAEFKTPSACIKQLVDDAPGQKAGLQVGDCIVAFNHQPIKHYADLISALYQTSPGLVVTIDIKRNKTPQTFEITLSE